MEFRDLMWALFTNTGNLDVYLTYRACLYCDRNEIFFKNSFILKQEEEYYSTLVH